MYLSFYGHTCSMWKFPAQGLNLSCSCSNTGSLDSPVPGRGSNLYICSDLSCSSWILNPLHHDKNS